MVKNPPNAGDVRDTGLIPGWDNTLEEGTNTHASILAWRIPWTEEPGGLQPIASQRVRHDTTHHMLVHSSQVRPGIWPLEHCPASSLYPICCPPPTPMT